MTDERMPAFVDASVFLGMHSADEASRRACKNFFVARFERRVAMSFEQIGLCDDFVWRHSRELQDLYYPFMDCLHSMMKFDRRPYVEADILYALNNMSLRRLSMPVRLSLAQASGAQGLLYSLHPELAERGELPVRRPPDGAERNFPAELEARYRASLCLRVAEREV
jgi:hypothetical protein